MPPLAPTPSLEWLAGFDDGRSSLADLPRRLSAVSRTWSLEVTGEPFDGGMCGLVLPVTARGHLDAVLKLQFPHDESAFEADALRVWDGAGAIRLVEHDPSNDALLLERCRPGHSLAEATTEDALAALAEIVGQLAVEVDGPFVALVDEVARWRDQVPANWDRAGRPFDRAIVDGALRVMDELVATQGPPVLVHQELHGDNVLAATRRPWLAIDPKPVVGEVAFALAPIVRSAELGHSRADVIGRLDFLAHELGVDRERARKWTIVQTLAWGFHDDHAIAGHIEVVRWLLVEE